MAEHKLFQLKEILPNPYRDLEKNPLDEATVLSLMESVKTTGFWEDRAVRINDEGKPELVTGHHMLAALRRIYDGSKEFEFTVITANDGEMIQRMARENSSRKKPDVATLFEAIESAVAAYGAGKIGAGSGAGQIAPTQESGKRTDLLRYAPSFSVGSEPRSEPPQAAENKEQYPYTVETLAAFLGENKPKNGDATNSFYAAFGALELINGGYLKRNNALSLEIRKLGEVVAAVKKQRDAAIKEAERLAREAEARRRKAAELKMQQEEAEVRRKAAAEAERLATMSANPQRVEEARLKVEAAKKVADDADRKFAVAEADAERKADAAKKEAAEAKADVKAMADKLAEEAKTMNRDNIRSRGQSIAEETAAKSGRKAAPRASSATFRCNAEDLKKFNDYVNSAGTFGARRTQVPLGLFKIANEIVSVGMKTLAKTRHPDHGGSQEDMQMLNLATQWLRQMIEKENTK